MPHTRLHTRLIAAAIGVVATVALAGCAGHAAPSATTPGSSAVTTWTPKGNGQVDQITWNVFEGEPQTIDPFKSADYTPNMINSNMCETLLVQTPEFTIKPNLAQSYANPDPLTWVYQIRQGVTFWDGSPMTAADVVYSMKQNLDDPTSLYNYLYANVASITQTGPYQVTVKLKRPDYLFNDELASDAGAVVEKKFGLEHGDKVGTPQVGLMCTGPYKFVRWVQGQSIDVTRYDGYWNNKTITPKVKNITFTFLTDDSAITSGLLSGQIDGTFNVPVAGIPQLQASSAGALYSGPAPIETTLVVADPHGALADVDVRKALQMAIDWNGIGAQVYGGEGTPAALEVPKSAFGFAASTLTPVAEKAQTDGKPRIAEAKKLLQSVPASVKSQPISLVVPQQNETQQLGIAVKSAANKIGLNFTLHVVPATGYSNYLYDPATRGTTSLLYTEFWPNIPNPLDWIGITAVKGGSFNQSGYSGVDALYAQAVGTKDPAQRAKLVADIEQTLHDQMNPMFPGVELNSTVWLGKRITGAPAAFAYVYYPWAAYLGGTGK